MSNRAFDAFETIFLLVLTLVAVSVACSQQISTPVPTAEPTATRLVAVAETVVPFSTTSQWTATVSRAQINVRDEPDGTVMTHLKSGDEVTIIRCLADWCKISNPVTGWVWRGCLSDNPKKLGCEAK